MLMKFVFQVHIFLLVSLLLCETKEYVKIRRKLKELLKTLKYDPFECDRYSNLPQHKKISDNKLVTLTCKSGCIDIQRVK